MSNAKKIALIIGLILVAVIIGTVIYFYIFKGTGISFLPFGQPKATTTAPGQLPSSGQRQTTTTTGIAVTPGSLPTAGTISQTAPSSYYQPKAVTKLTSDYVVYPSLNNSSGQMRYHNNMDGKFYRITSDGEVKELADKIFYNVDKVTWAKTKDEAVIEYPDKSKIIYDFENNKQFSLPKHWQEFSFSADSKEIVAKSMGISPDNRWLVTVKDDGTGVKTVEPMGNNAQYVTVDWSPSRQAVAFSQTGDPIGSERREVLLVGLNNENFKSLTVEGIGFESQWSPTGKKLLYSVYSGRSSYKPELWIVNSYGDTINQNRQMLNLNTWPEKCAFGDDYTIYCAVPRTLTEGAGMAKALANSTPDDLYKIDLTAGLKTPIKLDKDYTFDSISYDSKNNKVLFTDKGESGVFEAKL